MKPITPLTSTEYFAEIIDSVQRVGSESRVALSTMTFDAEEGPIAALIDALVAAAERGAQVTLAVDAHSFMINSSGWPTGPLFWHRPPAESTVPAFKARWEALERLRAAGGRYAIINMPTTQIINPYAGRSHIKATVIDGTSYLGGCNLGGTNQADMMLRITDAKITEWIYMLIQGMTIAESAVIATEGKDRTYRVDEQTELLLDSGVINQSIIMERAMQLLERAHERIFMTCQFFPDEPVITALEQAIRRGVAVELVYNHPSRQEQPTQLIHRLLLLSAKLSRQDALFINELPSDHPHLHLKLIATEHGSLIGSHNYVRKGVAFGTAELAMHRENPAFAAELVAKARTMLRTTPTAM
jgi:phosphatidylserine/phosphatidylglycerophosphate/cardiolipin synthase-like enzyme